MSLLLALILMFAGGQPAVVADQVELFDTDQERVVETYANSAAFQEEAKHMLSSVNGRVLDLSPSLSKALILKIPLTPPQKLSVPSARIDETVAEMFVVMPKEGKRKPWLILHTKENQTLIVEFGGELTALRKLAKLS